MASHHKSNLGRFGDSLPVDLDGYTHTTQREWLRARVDGMTERDQEWAKDMARRSRVALKHAKAGVREWNGGAR